MKRPLFVLTMLLLGGLIVIWFVNAKIVDLATAAFHSGVAAPASQRNPAVEPTDRAPIHLVQGGRTPAPGGPIAPKLSPRPVLPPKFPAEASMPAELLQAKKLSATVSPLQSFPDTFEGRMGKLKLFSQTNALPPPRSAPPEMQMLGKATSPPNTPTRPTPTIKELHDQLLTVPGGREMIEEARRRGARISRQPFNADPSFFAVLNPFSLPDAQAAQSFSVTFTPEKPKNSYLTFSGIWLWYPYKPLLDAGIHTGGPQGKSYAAFNVNVPRDGFYWVSIVAYASHVKATLQKAGIPIISWDSGPGPGVVAYGVIVELAQGSHTFYWFVERGTAQFEEVSVQENQ